MATINHPVRASTPKRAKLDTSMAMGGHSGDESDILSVDSKDQSESGSSYYLPTASTEEYLFVSDDSDNEAESCVFDICQNEVSRGSESILFLDSTNTTGETVVSSDEISDSECYFKPCSKKECCIKKCLEGFSIKEFNSTTQHFKSKTSTEQRQFLLDSLVLTSPTGASTSALTQESFMLYGKPVCKAAFALLLGTSERRLDRIKSNLSSGNVAHGNRGVKRPSIKSINASAWMNEYFLLMGDHMPDSDRVHLPSFLTKREVYQKMSAALLEDGVKDIISLSTFYELKKKEYNHVIIPEVS